MPLHILHTPPHPTPPLPIPIPIPPANPLPVPISIPAPSSMHPLPPSHPQPHSHLQPHPPPHPHPHPHPHPFPHPHPHPHPHHLQPPLLPLPPVASNPPPLKRRRTTPRKKHRTPQTPPPRSTPPKHSLNGLKSFTTSVVSKLRLHAPSSYTKVADELVSDALHRLRASHTPFSVHEVDKNIRRRVYDALNVLASMGFVRRRGKDVAWLGVAGFIHHVGWSVAGQRRSCRCHVHGGGVVDGVVVGGTCVCQREVSRIRRECELARERLREKTRRMEELRSQEMGLKKLVSRNAMRDVHRVTMRSGEMLAAEGLDYVRPDAERVDLPFVMVSVGKERGVEVEMDEQRERVMVRVDGPFRVFDGFAVVGMVCEGDKGKPGGLDMWSKLYDGYESSPVTRCGDGTPGRVGGLEGAAGGQVGFRQPDLLD